MNDQKSGNGKQAMELHDKLKLIRALANFSTDEESLAELRNQRAQLLQCLHEFQDAFAEFAEELAIGGSPDSSPIADRKAAAAIALFIEQAVPRAQWADWQSGTFTGSLQVVFEDGQITASHLTAAQPQLQFEAALDESAGDDTVADWVEALSQPNQVCQGFTVLKSRMNAGFNFYFTLSTAARLRIDIKDQNEVTVRSMEKHFKEPGDYVIEWDARRDDGTILPRDIYSGEVLVNDVLVGQKRLELR